MEASGEKSFAHKAMNDGEKPFVNLTIEIKRSWNTAMRRCEEPQRCQRAIRVGDLSVGRSTSLFTNGFVSAYRYELVPGGTISSNFYAPGKNFVLLAALTDLKGNFGGIEQELKATQLFGSDGADMEITAPRDQTLRWVVLRFTWK